MIDLDTLIPCPSCGRTLVCSGLIWRCPSSLCGWRAGEARPTLRWYANGNAVVSMLVDGLARDPGRHETAKLREQLTEAERQASNLAAALRLAETRETDARVRLGDAYREIARLRYPRTIRGWFGRWVGGER